MPRSSEEILGPARTELARGRPRAALKELEQARAELLANADLDGLKELLELARAIKTLAPADTKARERLLAATEEGIESLAPGTVVELAETPSERTPPAEPRVSFTPYGLVSTEQIFAPARAEIERGGKNGSAAQVGELADQIDPPRREATWPRCARCGTQHGASCWPAPMSTDSAS